VTRSLFLCAVLLAARPAEATFLYGSDFRSSPAGPAALKHWRLVAGDYRIEGGWLRVTSKRSNPKATLDVTCERDCTFRATVRNARNCHRVALFARGVYRLEVNRQFGRLSLERLSGNGWKLVASAPRYWDYARLEHEFELRLVVVDQRVVGFIDDKKMVAFDDPERPASGGAFGLLGGWGTDVAWRNISLSDEPDLEEGPCDTLPSPAAKDLVAVTRVRGHAGDGIYFDEQPAVFKLALTTKRGAALVRLTYRLVDVHGKTVAQQSRAVSLRRGAEVEQSIGFVPPRRGCFKVALHAAADGEESGWVEDLGSFIVVPKAVQDRRSDRESYFGGHMDGINLDWHLRAGRKIGIRWARTHDMLQHTWWTRVQPDNRNQWIWADTVQDRLDGLGFSVLGTFLWTPAWAAGAAQGKTGTSPPKDYDDFGRYVFHLVSHYRRSIHCWEVWNEPHYSGFWRGTPAEYARLLVVAYREAKRADPDCLVLGGGGVEAGNLRWTEQMLAAVDPSVRTMDGFSVHYVEPEAAVGQLRRLRKLLGDGGQDVPIWNTEASVPSTSFLDQCRQPHLESEARFHYRNACCELVRMYMENIAAGVARLFYYEQADPWRFKTFAKPRPPRKTAVGRGMWDEGRAFKPLAAAHAALAHAIEGKTFRTRVSADDLRAFVFEGKDTSTVVLYAMFPRFSDRTTLRLKLPPGLAAMDLTIIDFMGNESSPVVKDVYVVLPLSRQPVYLVCRKAGAAKMLLEMFKNGEPLPHSKP